MKKKTPSIKDNFVYNIVYHIVTICTPLITSPIISRNLGASQLGIYSYTYSIAYYFYLFGMLGVKNYGNRSVARARDNKENLSKSFSSIFCFQILSSAIFITAYIFYIVVLCKDNILIAYIQGLLVLSATFDISWFFFGLEMFKNTSIKSTIVKIFTVLLIVLFVHQPTDLWKYTLIMAGGTLLAQLVLWPALKELVVFSWPSFKMVLSHFKPNLILFIPVIATNLFKFVDKIMLGQMSVMSELGYYENAERLIQFPNSLVTALGTVMLPRISNLAKYNEKDKASFLTYKSMLISVFACSAIAFGVVGIADVFVPFFFGEEFIPVTPLLWLLAPTAIFISWGDVIKTQYLLPNMKDIQFLITVIIASGINFVVNYLLIPILGAKGASIGTLCAEFLVCFLQTCMVINKLPIKDYLKACLPFIGFGAVMFLAICKINIGSNFASLIFRFIIGATVYMLLTVLYLYKYQRDVLYSIVPIKLVKIIFK